MMILFVDIYTQLTCGHPQDHELVSLIARVRNTGNLFQSNVCNLLIFVWDLAAFRIIGVSVIVRYLQGES